MSNNRELKWGSVLSYVQMIASVLLGIIYTPTMIRMMGQSEYGLYSTVNSSIAVLSILSLGLNSSYVRFFAKYRKENDQIKINRLNGLFLLLFAGIGLVALGIGLYFTDHLEMVFKDGLTRGEYKTAKTLMMLLTVRMALSFPMSVFSTIISAHERFIYQKLIGMVAAIIEPIVNIPLLMIGIRSVGLVISSIVFSILCYIANVYYVFRRIHSRFQFTRVEKKIFKSIFTFTIFIAINMIVDQINNNIDRVLLARFCGTVEVAIYSIGANLYNHYVQISLAASGVFTPRVHSIYNENSDKLEQNKAITELFIKIGRIQFLLLGLISSGYIIFGKAFLLYWVGEGYDDAYYIGLLLMLPATIPLIQNIGIEIQRAANKHQFRSIIYLGMAICNFILTIYLCPIYGAIGAAVGTAISLIVANGFIMNWFYYRKIGINIPEFWKQIFKMSMGMCPAFLLGAVIKMLVIFSNVWLLLGSIVFYTGVYVISAWKLSMNSFEKGLCTSPFRNIRMRASK